MITRVPDKQFLLQFEGYALVTALIIYRLPDHLLLLQEYVWQDYDLAPRYPKLDEFLSFWDREIEGPIYAVEVVRAWLIAPAEIRLVERTEFSLN